MEKKKNLPVQVLSLVGEGGFEPPKASPADLQSVPFGHSGIPPYSVVVACTDVGAGGRTRTPDLLITNQLLYRLSYTSITGILATIQPPGYISKKAAVCQPVFLFSLSWSDSALTGRRCLICPAKGKSPQRGFFLWCRWWDSTFAAAKAASGGKAPPALCQDPSGSRPVLSCQRKKPLVGAFSFGAGGGTRTHTGD